MVLEGRRRSSRRSVRAHGGAPSDGGHRLPRPASCAEKAIKGFLCWHDLPVRKTHNLLEIGEAAVAVDPALEPALRRAAPMTEYAWRFRYPGDATEPPIEEAREALVIANEVFESLLSRLPSEVRP